MKINVRILIDKFIFLKYKIEKLLSCFLTIAPHTTLIIDTYVNYRQLFSYRQYLCSKLEVNNSYKLFEKCKLQTFLTKHLAYKQLQVVQKTGEIFGQQIGKFEDDYKTVNVNNLGRQWEYI